MIRPSHRFPHVVLAFAGVAAAVCSSAPALAHGAGRDVPVDAPSGASGYSAILEQCVTSSVAAERSVTFTAEMIAASNTAHMSIRVELQQRLPGESAFRTVLAPGLGVWRSSEAGVKIYKYVKQVTNLAAPGEYRAIVRFRWLGANGRVLRHAGARTPTCVQPLLQPVPVAPSA